MISAFRKLSAKEMEWMYKKPVLIWILIAGVDGTIGKKEMRKAGKLVKKKIPRANKLVSTVFQEIAQDVKDKVKILVQAVEARFINLDMIKSSFSTGYR
jgi:hypothetical protein